MSRVESYGRSSERRRASQLRFAKGKTAKRRKPKKQDEGPSLLSMAGKAVFLSLGRGLKIVLIAAATVAGLVLVSGLLLAGYLYVSKSDYFSVKRVTISGINHISREEVIAAAGLDRAINILTYDAKAASAEVSIMPWVAGVEITRQMPDTVNIAVREHSPKLLINLGRLYYMNDKGEPFKELEAGEVPKLPIVSGFGEDDLLNPGPRVKGGLNEIFRLVDTLASRNDEFKLDNISEINYDMVRGLTLFTKVNRLEVKIGLGSYEEKFRRVGRVLAHLKLQGKYDGLVYLNLEASPRVTVRYDNDQATPTAGLAMDLGHGISLAGTWRRATC